jgi:hypothetical protein
MIIVLWKMRSQPYKNCATLNPCISLNSMDSRIWGTRNIADRRTRLTRRVSDHITQQLSIQGRITLPAKKLTTRVVISAGRGDFFSQGSSHIRPNLQMTFSHASWWSFTYCFHADLMCSMQETFDRMAIETPRRRGYYKCGGILRVLKYGDGFIKQQGLKTMLAC